MAKIQVMDEHLANQIAAGEVVERPASVVKELVENALDAKADRIQVEIEEGGIQFIRVNDNGFGMDREDAVRAFERHATSKIRRERDLFAIRSLGFRGEALPSIASVSRLTLTTSEGKGEPSTCVRLEGGKVLSVEDTTRSQGTEVVVKDLFFNTPARLKYLKTVNTEVSHVADVIGRLALAHPSVAFSLRHKERELFRTPGDGKLLHVVHALYGKQVARKMLSFSAEDMDFQVTGWIARPEVTRSNRSYVSTVINGRYIRSIPVVQTVLKAYDTLLPVGRYPIAVLAIEMDPKLVDVNVHPSKLEVRLSKEKELCHLIREGIRGAFQKSVLIPKADQPAKRGASTRAVQERFSWDEKGFSTGNVHRADRVHESAFPLYRGVSDTTTDRRNDPQKETENAQLSYEQKQRTAEQGLSNLRNEADTTRRYKAKEAPLQETAAAVDHVSEPKTLPGEMRDSGPTRENDDGGKAGSELHTDGSFPALTPLAQVHGTYIIAQSEDGFYLLDQHAAHERIYYEQFYRRLQEQDREQQQLLIPMTVECTPAEAESITGRLADLQEMGIEIEPFGGTSFLIRSHPKWFPQGCEEALLREILDWLKKGEKVDRARLQDDGAKTMACKAAIKANRHLRKDEMEELLQQLRRCETPYTCPHGRPILVHFSTYEIEKMFKRVM
ncbi:DNA mismatch repair protein MutL [Marinithermofilum abyssi]|uniref:DNA mismatch repair protein MutL n=1 Tax=Marinithermofilum abyssi TaxID=1571185 RepID=A0A8J2VIM8_9BACL|nr:DNA mismatch repair endonuclease MutL [Marinithermofilum abyssi]GGE24703.1 DNA mismatch repair protein MutL [Marinithermofilum abyssi]